MRICIALVMLIALPPRPARACDCASNGMKHVFVHYDYMVASDHTHAPDPAAIELVVEAYRRHGILLHVDPRHDAIPESRVITFDGFPQTGCFPGSVRFEDLKAQYFRASHPDEHYALFAHDVWCDSDASCAACGIELRPFGWSNGIGASDFAVTLGVMFDFSAPPDLLAQGGVFMHELGHNLGLQHGGGDATDHKPNYLSVMNNYYITIGVLSAAAPGLSEPVAARLDYSEVALPTLDESRLDETRGLGGSTSDLALHACWLPCGPFECDNYALVPVTGPVDWNCENGVEQSLVSEDISADRFFTPLTGFDDWAAIHDFVAHPRSVVRDHHACGRMRR